MVTDGSAPYNLVGVNGTRFLVQQNWDLASKACITGRSDSPESHPGMSTIDRNSTGMAWSQQNAKSQQQKQIGGGSGVGPMPEKNVPAVQERPKQSPTSIPRKNAAGQLPAGVISPKVAPQVPVTPEVAPKAKGQIASSTITLQGGKTRTGGKSVTTKAAPKLTRVQPLQRGH